MAVRHPGVWHPLCDGLQESSRCTAYEDNFVASFCEDVRYVLVIEVIAVLAQRNDTSHVDEVLLSVNEA